MDEMNPRDLEDLTNGTSPQALLMQHRAFAAEVPSRFWGNFWWVKNRGGHQIWVAAWWFYHDYFHDYDGYQDYGHLWWFIKIMVISDGLSRFWSLTPHLKILVGWLTPKNVGGT